MEPMKKLTYACLGLSIVAVFAAVLASPARSEDKVLGLFDDWGAQTFVEKGKTGCSIWSQPNKEGGNAKERGAVYVYVTHRPWEKRIDEVSLVAGYPYKKDSTVHARIGGQKFTLFTDGDTAWNRSPKEDNSLVAAMRRGNSMVVTGVPKKGKQTTDTYSLTGFSKAYDAIAKACGLTR
jgi:hypothetical protein